MSYFSTARTAMVKNQIATNKVTDERILHSFHKIHRHDFVDGEWKNVAYSDARLPMIDNRTMLSPNLLARMIQALELKETSKVMVIGCGTGYSLAIIAPICLKVVGVEPNNILASKAASYIAKEELDNVSIVANEYFTGAPIDAPFHAILIDGAIESCPKNLTDQLAKDGRLICIERSGNSCSKVVMYQNVGSTIARLELFEGFGDFLA
jgi:protein-L-isoaspartate(D-aspartate) O-methyltransferase